MEHDEFIPVTVICHHYNVEVSFVDSLHEFNLVEVRRIESENYIPAYQLTEVERIIRLHNELNINPEGLDAVLHLLEKVKTMQTEIGVLRTRLSLYE